MLPFFFFALPPNFHWTNRFLRFIILIQFSGDILIKVLEYTLNRNQCIWEHPYYRTNTSLPTLSQSTFLWKLSPLPVCMLSKPNASSSKGQCELKHTKGFIIIMRLISLIYPPTKWVHPGICVEPNNYEVLTDIFPIILFLLSIHFRCGSQTLIHTVI